MPNGGPLSVIGSLADLSFLDNMQVIHPGRQSGARFLRRRGGGHLAAVRHD